MVDKGDVAARRGARERGERDGAREQVAATSH